MEGEEKEEETEQAERDRLYFEMKSIGGEKEGKEFERRLETLIGSRRIKENGFNRHKKMEGGLNKSQVIEMKIKRPTYFPALLGDGFVDMSGERSYDFLLLDWRPKTQDMIAVLEVATGGRSAVEVRVFGASFIKLLLRLCRTPRVRVIM